MFHFWTIAFATENIICCYVHLLQKVRNLIGPLKVVLLLLVVESWTEDRMMIVHVVSGGVAS